jgi:hypothetical protein
MDDFEVEVYNFEVDNDGSINAEVRVARLSACCGTEVREATYEFNDMFEHECAKLNTTEDGEVSFDADEPDFEVEEGGGSRYAKNMISCFATASVTCDVCEEVIEVELKEEIAASGYDDMY